MPGLIINGKEVTVPGRKVVNYKDDPKLKLKLPEDGRSRAADAVVDKIVLHTTKGIPGGRDTRPQLILDGLGPDSDAEHRTASWWSTSDKQSGAHGVIDFDGSIGWLADGQLVTCYHARALNKSSVGLEIYQGAKAELYLGQLAAVADLLDVLTATFGIQRQIPDKYRGPLQRLMSGGDDYTGVCGHRDGDDNRGFGDPGDAVLDVLAARGYERFNIRDGQDREVWRQRQAQLNKTHKAGLVIDGIPGRKTRDALAKAGYKHGLWACPPA